MSTNSQSESTSQSSRELSTAAEQNVVAEQNPSFHRSQENPKEDPNEQLSKQQPVKFVN